jgi:hypothetical protein
MKISGVDHDLLILKNLETLGCVIVVCAINYKNNPFPLLQIA